MNPTIVRLGTVLAVFLSSCATTHPGNRATRLDASQQGPELDISVKEIENQSGDTFGLFDVTFENLEDDWAKIETVDVLISENDVDKVAVVVGKDLDAWTEAMKNKIEQESYNEGLLLGSLAAAGAVASALTSDSQSDAGKTVNAAGTTLVAGTLSYVVYDALKAARESVNGARRTPENHIYYSFTVPGKMFVRRWVLLKKPSKAVFDKVSFRVKTIDGRAADYMARVYGR